MQVLFLGSFAVSKHIKVSSSSSLNSLQVFDVSPVLGRDVWAKLDTASGRSQSIEQGRIIPYLALLAVLLLLQPRMLWPPLMPGVLLADAQGAAQCTPGPFCRAAPHPVNPQLLSLPVLLLPSCRALLLYLLNIWRLLSA